MKALETNIVLIGFMGTGKTTVAKALQQRFGMDIVEMDQIIAAREGMSISEIFASRGEAYFRDAETHLLIELQQRENVIISCGGGTPLREVNTAEMKKIGRVILLTARPETVLARVEADHGRPLLENNKDLSHIAAMMEQRRPRYEAAADVIIDTDGKSAEEICGEIAETVCGTGEAE